MPAEKYDLRQLRCFITVADELNFSRAAERLNMTQPPLSRQIRLLERAVGLTLLDRTNKVTRLTPAGESFYASAVDLLQRAELAVLKARQAERGEAGSVAMGFVPSAALEFVPRIVATLAETMPDVSFQPAEMMSYEIVEALRSGRLDFGLTRMAREDPEIEKLHVVSDSFVLALPAGHPLTRRSRVTLADLDGVDFVGYSADRGGYLREVLSGIFASAAVAPRPVQEVSQTHSILALVNHGIGVALVPASSQAMRMDALRYRDIDIPERFTSDLFLAFGPRRRSALQAAVAEAIAAALRDFAPRSARRLRSPAPSVPARSAP